MQHRAFAFALVDDMRDVRAPDHDAGRRQRRVQPHRLLAMHEPHGVDAQLRPIAHPETRRCKHRGHRRKRDEVFFVDEAQLCLVDRIGATAQTQRVEDRVFRGVGLADVAGVPGADFAVVEHRFIGGTGAP